MQADIHELFQSDFYRVVDFRCRCSDCRESKPEYAETFCISFIRKGNFLFNVFRHSFDSHTGRMLVTKPGYEHTVTHVHTVPDECTIVEFRRSFYDELLDHFGRKALFFFNNNDLHSLLLATSVETEYIHQNLIRSAGLKRTTKLEMDAWVVELIQLVVQAITGNHPINSIKPGLKKNHLLTIEKAKEFIGNRFMDDLSLKDVADHCHVSAFHFSRLFKTFTSYSPHQYLLQLRLKHAEMLLRTTSLPVTDICFRSGFNSLEHFSASFSQKFKQPPSGLRSDMN